MKVNRDQLKAVIKECLVEILSEGLGTQTSKVASQPQKRAAIQENVRATAADKIVFNQGPSKTVNPRFNSNVKQTAAMLTKDPTMQMIFEDTAKTTLQESLREEQTSTAPIDVFQGSNRWESLAFLPSTKKM